VLLFVLFGAVTGFWAALGVLLLVSSWLVLSYHYFSGYKAKVLMDSIVGPHRTPEEFSNWGQHKELDVSRLLRPFSDFKDDQIKLIKNVTFTSHDNLDLKLDIRRNLGACENAPVLLQIHGGAWTYRYGSKNEQGVPLTVEMAKRGWVCVSISYRLSPDYTFPDPLLDCKKALAWVKEHIAEYGGNPDFVVVTGGSAGGHLSSLLALTENKPEFQPGFESVDTRVQGCVPFYGIYDLLDRQKLQLSPGLDILLRKKIIRKTKDEAAELYEQMSPLSQIHENAPPFLLVHGDKDSLTSLGEAQYFASELDKVSHNSVEFAEVAGAQHAFDVFASVRSDYVIQGVAERLQQWHRDSQA
jgi:acetyl esterase/lipase